MIFLTRTCVGPSLRRMTTQIYMALFLETTGDCCAVAQACAVATRREIAG
jgi:hypothetical protein